MAFPPRIEESVILIYRTGNLKQLQIYFTSSQLYAKVSIPDICSIPIQANKARHIIGVTFDFNAAPSKNGMAFNTM